MRAHKPNLLYSGTRRESNRVAFSLRKKLRKFRIRLAWCGDSIVFEVGLGRGAGGEELPLRVLDPTDYINKKSPIKGLFLLMEPAGVEPASENLSTQLSPGADILLISPILRRMSG